MQPMVIRTPVGFSTWIGRFFACAAIVGVAAGAVLAQFPGGGDGQGGERRDGDRRDGGGQGGDGRGGGGRSFGGFNPEDYLKAMDANGNGLLEPSEIPEDRRARMFLEWTAREAKIDLKQPVPIAKLQESMQAARERMRGGGMGGGGMGGRPGGGDSNRDGNRDGGNRDQGSGNRPEGTAPVSPQPMANKPATLVAGFGGQSAAVQSRGFGGGAHEHNVERLGWIIGHCNAWGNDGPGNGWSRSANCQCCRRHHAAKR